MNFRSINFKLIVGGCLAVLIPLLISGVISVGKTSTALTRISKNNTESTAADIASLVNKALEEEKKIAAAFASGALVRSTTTEVNTLGIENSAGNIAPLRQAMKSKYKLLGDQYLGIFVANADGILFTGELTSGKEYKGSNISTRTYFQQAKK